MLKAIIIEDEIGSVNVLLKLLADNPIVPIQIMGVAVSIKTGLELIQNQKPEVVFMDVELRDGSSFQILEQLPSIDFKLIFVTAFDKFAIDAFRFSAIDYLLKPIDNKLFYEVIKKLSDKEPHANSDKQFKFLKEVKDKTILEKVNKIALFENREIIFESLDNIISLRALESYTEIHSTSKKYTMSKNLGHFQELLSGHENFVRIHYSTIVNLNYIKKLSQNESNRQFRVEMQNGIFYEVSQRRVSEFKKLIKQ
jgi:two-component system LytT family response regulator